MIIALPFHIILSATYPNSFTTPFEKALWAFPSRLGPSYQLPHTFETTKPSPQSVSFNWQQLHMRSGFFFQIQLVSFHLFTKSWEFPWICYKLARFCCIDIENFKAAHKAMHMMNSMELENLKMITIQLAIPKPDRSKLKKWHVDKKSSQKPLQSYRFKGKWGFLSYQKTGFVRLLKALLVLKCFKPALKCFKPVSNLLKTCFHALGSKSKWAKLCLKCFEVLQTCFEVLQTCFKPASNLLPCTWKQGKVGQIMFEMVWSASNLLQSTLMGFEPTLKCFHSIHSFEYISFPFTSLAIYPAPITAPIYNSEESYTFKLMVHIAPLLIIIVNPDNPIRILGSKIPFFSILTFFMIAVWMHAGHLSYHSISG